MKKSIRYISLVIATGACLMTWMESCRQKNASQRVSNEFVFAEKLSQYGFFQGEMKAQLVRNNGDRYELITPLFTDYAVKDRFIILPAGQAMQYRDSGVLDFPDSTFILKSFSYIDSLRQKVLIETRMLFKDPFDHHWKVMDYVWNQAQTDAVKTIIGANIPIALRNADDKLVHTNYLVPNTNDCKRCHNNNNILIPIGPKARNLNFIADAHIGNQLQAWSAKGRLKGLPAAEKIPLLPNWQDDKRYSITERARAYLDVNCAHCHIPGGDAVNTGLFLQYEETKPIHLGINKEPLSAGGGAGGLNYDLVPGDAKSSILAYRMNSTEPGTAMPELGRTLIHYEGVKLVQDWINQMKKADK
ncbi:MAG TPA: SO2930 family diheme c-type cytochrome [Flavihumibacter sp.]|nr:SO2930 family diheme c-type cytochrome [Flavihumibacter sp.]